MRFASHLQTPRLRLRPLRLRDLVFFFRLLGNRRVRKHLGGPVPWKARLRQFRAYLCRRADTGLWCVTLGCGTLGCGTQGGLTQGGLIQAEGRAIGLIMITPDRSRTAQELSYQFLPVFWGNGLATEAASCVLQHIQTEVQSAIIAETQAANTKSCALLSRLGFSETDRLMRFGAEQIQFSFEPRQDHAQCCAPAIPMRPPTSQRP